MPSCAKARGVSRHTLRENWSSTTISASRPGVLARQPDSSPRAAASKVRAKRRAMAASSAASLAKCCAALSSSNQNCSTAVGSVGIEWVMVLNQIGL